MKNIGLYIAILLCLLTISPAWADDLSRPGRGRIEQTVRIIAKKHGIRPSHLLAIAEQESGFNAKAKGDKKNGRFRSWGMFQIRTKLHGVSKKKALDYKWAGAWACRYLIKRGYRKNPERGIRRYNGGGKPGSRGRIMSEAYVKDVLKRARKYK